MKVSDHIKSYFKVWEPSVSARITFYFFIFAFVVFILTTLLFFIYSRKQFIASASKLINHQISLIEGSEAGDFIWDRVGKEAPDLFSLFQMIRNITSTLYRVHEISIYARTPEDTDWFSLYFSDDSKSLKAVQSLDSETEKIEKILHRHFLKKGQFFHSDDEHILLINITGESDRNEYFMRIGIDSESFIGMMKNEAKWFILIFIIIMLTSRLLGYFFAHKISRPIEELSKISEKVAKGNLSSLAEVSTRDEIGKLSTNFNKMVEGLRDWERIKKIEFELEKGREIQKEFLPRHIPHLPNWEIATCFYPAGKVSGDFYDVFMLPGECVGLVIADVCDKGVGSALYMALFRSLIRVFSEQALSREIASNPPVSYNGTAGLNLESGLKAVHFTNNYIAQTHGDEGMFATLFFGVLDPLNGTMCYVNGGHEPLYLINKQGIKGELKRTGPAVGIMPDPAFKINRIQIDPGDMLVGYTDGVTEARSPDDELFTRTRLLELLSQPFQSASETIETIKSTLFTFIDIAPRWDDVTIIAVQREFTNIT